MHIQPLRIADVRYNPERGAFEALVTLHDGTTVFRYPAAVVASLQAGFPLIARRLVAQALAAHHSARPGLRLRRAAAAKPASVPLAA